ncbi:MAG: lipocalin family protein [Gammaproteobacteria bacterium]|nr:lipocalin family protein [Gammaproteobacteria bacterium]
MKKTLTLPALFTLLASCSNQPAKPIHTVDYVDLDRFIGNWYVIANIPTFIEKDAYNAIESYARNADGTIATTFTFSQGSADGERKQYNPTGFIVDKQSNALWGMQFIWPFKAEYRVIYLDDAYQTTIIGRSKRDYVWLMSRQSSIDDSSYTELLAFMESQGYDISKVQKVPQVWPQTADSNSKHKEDVLQ